MPDEYTIKIVRYRETRRSTIGRLRMLRPGTDMGSFSCVTLELPWRDNAIGKSRVPPGEYPLVKDLEGRFVDLYSKKFGHKYVPKLGDTAPRSEILFHIGNYPKNTHGCILVGEKPGDDYISRSTQTYKRFYEMLLKRKPVKVIIYDDFQD